MRYGGYQPTLFMKTTLASLLVISAAAAALFKLANAEFLAGFPAATAASVVFTIALFALAIAEYGRERTPLKLPRRIVRPGTPKPASLGNAYGIRRRSAIVERVAA